MRISELCKMYKCTANFLELLTYSVSDIQGGLILNLPLVLLWKAFGVDYYAACRVDQEGHTFRNISSRLREE